MKFADIEKLYLAGKSTYEIATICNCSGEKIRQQLRQHGVVRRTKNEAIAIRGLAKRRIRAKKCLECGGEFYPTYYTKKHKKSAGRGQRFCSASCYMNFLNFSYQRAPKQVSKSGYIYRKFGGFCQYEHRYVVEKYLGRKLIKGEQVHHIDGNKQNNDLNNLAVVRTGEHWLITRLQHFKSFSPEFKKIVLQVIDEKPEIRREK